MPVYSSLLSKIPIPQQQWQTKSETPAIASIKVSDVNTESEETPSSSFGFLSKFVESFKQKLIEKRIQKLESIPEDLRTPVQQAEIEANQKSLIV